MAGIINKTARQYNLKCVDKKGRRVTVRIAPGFNVVDDDHWKAFKTDTYALGLKKKGLIDFGKKWDDEELERDSDTLSKSKAVNPPKSEDEQKAEAEAKLALIAQEALDNADS